MPRELVPLDELSLQQVKLFAEAIFLSTGSHTSKQKRRLLQIQFELDQKLLRPDLITRLLTGGQSRYTSLCAGHKFLNASPVHSIFLLFQLEVGSRLNSVFQVGRDSVGHYLWDHTILNLRSLHGLWMTSEVLKRTFKDSLLTNSDDFSPNHYYQKWHLESDGCEACMIGEIVNDPKTLFELWALSKSRVARNRRHPKIPRLLAWLDVFVDLCTRQFGEFGQLNIADVLAKSADSLTDELYAVRKSIRRSGRHGRRSNLAVDVSSIHRSPGRTEKGKDANKLNQARHSQKARSAGHHVHVEDEEAMSDLSDIGEDEERDFQRLTNNPLASYASLINTPFLPHMSVQQQKEAEKVLTQTMLTQSKKSEQPDGISSADDKLSVKLRAHRSSSADMESPNIAISREQNPVADRKAPRESVQSQWTNASVVPSETYRSAYSANRDLDQPASSSQAAGNVRLDNITEESLSNFNKHQKLSKANSNGQNASTSHNIEDWASGVSQETTMSRNATVARKRLPTIENVDLAPKVDSQRNTHLLDEEDPEQAAVRQRQAQGPNKSGARLSQPFDQPSVVVAVNEENGHVAGYTFEDLLKEDQFGGTTHPTLSETTSLPILLPLRYDPDRQTGNHGSAATAPGLPNERVQGTKPTDPMNIRHALRPFSGESQQTTWSGMYKNLAVNNGHHSVMNTHVPLEPYMLNKTTAQCQDGTRQGQ